MPEVTTNSAAVKDDVTALRDALGMMIRTFNVKEIDPLVAFASIEKARAVFDRTAPPEERESALEDDEEQEQGLSR